MTTFPLRLCLIVVALGGTVGGSTAEEPAAPPAAELSEAVDLLKDVYEKDYRAAETDASAKKALARKLFETAPKRKTVAVRYACYDEARRLAAVGGDVRLALEALTALTTRFRGTPAELTDDTLKLLGGTDPAPEGAADLAVLVTEAVNAALEREDFVGAVALGQFLVATTKKSADPDRQSEAKKLLTRVEALKSAADTVKTEPDDPVANLALGRYWTFTRGRWDVGLKYLAKGPSGDLATAAKKDIANPRTARERTTVADLWYALAKEHTGAEQKRLVDRAWDWYTAARAVALGDENEKPAERITEIEKSYPELFDRSFGEHSGPVAGVAVTPDGKTLVSVGNDKTVRLWDVSTGKLLKTLEGHNDWVGSVVITPDGARAVTAGGDHVIRVWDLKAQKEVMKLEGHTVAVRALALTGDGRTLISGSSDKTCRAWNLSTGKEIKRYGDREDAVESVAVTPNGAFVLVGTDVGVVTVYDAKTGAVKSKYDKHDGTTVYTVVTTADGKTAYSGARDKDVHVWDVATGREIKRLKGHTEQVYQLALSTDGKYLVSVSFDKTVRVWDANGKELKKFTGHKDGVQGTCITTDGRFVFSAGWDKSVRRWRLPMFPPGGKKVD